MGLDAPSEDLTERLRRLRKRRVQELAGEGNEIVRIGKPVEITNYHDGTHKPVPAPAEPPSET